MEWQILIVGGGTLLAFMGLVFKPLFNLTKTLTTLNITMELLRKDLLNFKENNKETHKEIFKQLKDHQTRIEKSELQIETIKGKETLWQGHQQV